MSPREANAVTVLLAIAAAETQSSGYEVWAEFIIRQVGFGLLSGVVIGLAGGWILHRRAVANYVEGIYRQLATLAVAAGAFTTAELLEDNGFIAAVVAGLAFVTSHENNAKASPTSLKTKANFSPPPPSSS